MSAPDVVGLRRLLGEALAVSHALGEEPLVEPDGVGYFSSEAGNLDGAIQRMADCDEPISMFVGAGVSMEAGLPSWEDLVRRLLGKVAGDLSPEDRTAWIAATLSEGPLASAAIAKALHGDENAFRRALRAALYDPHHPSDYFPGALAQQLAWLKWKLGPRLRLLTANYDGLLEAALAKQGLRSSSYVRAWREREGKAAVWHRRRASQPAR